MVLFKRKPKDPFDPTGLEGLSITEQEKVLAQVASREAQFEQRPKAEKTKRGKRVKEEAEKRIKQLEKQKGFSRLRQSLIEKAEARKKLQKSREVGFRGLFSTTLSRRGLSPFQRNILQRERVLRFLRNTPPMDRAKALNKSSEFQKQREAIRSDIAPKTKPTGLTRFEDSPAQQAEARLKAKLLLAAGRR